MMDFQQLDKQLEQQISNKKSNRNDLPANILPKIYAYTEPQFKETPWEQTTCKSGKGLLKVGDTKKTVYERVKEQFATNKPISQPFEILVDENAIREDGSFFRDYDVHEVLENSGFYRFPNSEWFECNVEDVINAINSVKKRNRKMAGNYLNFKMRPEQEDAVRKTSEYLIKYSKENENGITPHYLWNCKMRFGKTFAAYQLAKKMGWSKLLVLTFKPVVEDAWKSDLENHEDFKNWQFISKNNIQPDEIDETSPYVRFASFQDVLQRTKLGGIKPYNSDIDKTEWDCVILDEFHFGAWRYKTPECATDEDKKIINEKKQIEDAEGDNKIDYYDEKNMPLKTSAYLYLSGTPFRALDNGDFGDNQIFSWTYSDEQKAKNEWNEADGENPYAELPQMILMTYKMPEEIEQVAKEGEFNEFDLNEFFSAKKINNHYIFKHEKEVNDWLKLIRGQYIPTKKDELKTNSRPPMPYSDKRLLSVLSHTYWFLPDIASCKAMGELLHEHPFYKDEYEIIVCAGNEAGVGYKALPPVQKKIGTGLKTKTITLSCGKLGTGVTVKQWGGILMLNNISTPETYFQSAFRVQSPWMLKNPDGKNPNEKHIIKNSCYVFDFAPNRALRRVSDYSIKLNTQSDKTPEEKVSDFLSFLPVLCYDGSSMQQLDAGNLLDYVIAGTSSSMLVRKWESALLVNVRNEMLEKLRNNEQAMAALSKIEAFKNLNKDISTIINKTENINKTKKEKTDDNVSKEDKKQLSDEEKEIKTLRKKIQEKLLQFAKRIPVFMYLTDEREHTLQDVIKDLAPELFQKVTGLTKNDFGLLVELGVFNESQMNEAVLRFKRYEDPSLEYTGIFKHSNDEYIGGYNTRLKKDEYIEYTNSSIDDDFEKK